MRQICRCDIADRAGQGEAPLLTGLEKIPEENSSHFFVGFEDDCRAIRALPTE
jgi:hypothetical protein